MRLYSDDCGLGGPSEPLRVGPATITIDDGVVVAVDEGPSTRSHEDGRVVLDRRLLTPAFVNGHTHLAMHAYRGLPSTASAAGNMVEDVFFRIEAHLEADDVRAFARIGALESVLHGVGVVYDHYYHAEAVAAGMRDVGLAGVVAPTLQDLGGPGRGHAEEALQSTVDLDAGSWAEAGIRAALGPHATDTVSGALWRRAMDLAGERGLPLHAHLAQSADETRRLLEREGRGPLAWLEAEGLLATEVPLLLVHALFLDARDLGRLHPDRHLLGVCPFSQMQFGFPAPVDEFDRAGVAWLAGTDCVPSNDGMNVQKELRVLAGQTLFGVTYGPERLALREGVDAARVEALERRRSEAISRAGDAAAAERLLARVWSVPGGWHPGLPTGAIEVGRRADLAVWDLDHPSFWPADGPVASVLRALAWGEPTPALRGLCIGGRWIGDAEDVRAVLRRPEVAAWFDEAEARRRALLERAGLMRRR